MDVAVSVVEAAEEASVAAVVLAAAGEVEASEEVAVDFVDANPLNVQSESYFSFCMIFLQTLPINIQIVSPGF